MKWEGFDRDRNGTSFGFITIGRWVIPEKPEGERNNWVYLCRYCKKFMSSAFGAPCKKLTCQWLCEQDGRKW